MHAKTILINAALLGSGRESGVERCIRVLIEALGKHGRMHYRVLARSNDPVARLNSERFKVGVIDLPTGSRILRIAWEQFVLPLRIRKNRPALLHAPGYVAPLWMPVPFVVTVYDLVALRFPQWAARANTWHYRFMLPAAIRRANAVVTPSKTVRDDVVQMFGRPENTVHVIPPAVAPMFFEHPSVSEIQATRQHYGLPSRFMLYVGNIEPKKNMEGLLDAYALLRFEQPDTPPLLVVGKKAWKSEGFVRRRRELGLVDRVPCLGNVSDSDLRVIYHLATLLTMPSWYEGYGLPPLEAMACGTPVVSSRGGALPETVGEAAMLVDADNPKDWARAIAKLLADRNLREKMAEEGRKQAARAGIKDLAAAHENLYREIISDF